MRERLTCISCFSSRAIISACRSVLSIRRAVFSNACIVVSMLSSRMVSCEKRARRKITIPEMTSTKLATNSVSFHVNEVRIF